LKIARRIGGTTRSQPLGERLRFEQLHDEVAVTDVEERPDVRVMELRDRLRFTFEAELELRVFRAWTAAWPSKSFPHFEHFAHRAR